LLRRSLGVFQFFGSLWVSPLYGHEIESADPPRQHVQMAEKEKKVR